MVMRKPRPRKKKEALITRLSKWPRHYAAEIIDEPDRAKRREMLSAVPEDLRGLAEEHVRNYFELGRHKF